MLPPGELAELGDKVSIWAALVEASVAEALARDPTEHVANNDAESQRRVVEWPAIPQRPRRCLGRDRAGRLLGMRDAQGDIGRHELQDEYAEWRMVGEGDQPERFELTTELPEYWELLAAHYPQRMLAVLSAFAQRTVTAHEVFGLTDPELLDADERGRRARGVLAPGRSGRPAALNNGVDAVTCLSHPTNTLEALVRLVVGSAIPMFTQDRATGVARAATASEFIAGRSATFAQDCRGSDPVVVERIVSLACDGRRIGFDDPLGIYIVGIQAHELLTPHGDPVSPEWFRFSRGRRRDGVSRYQRMTFTVPPGQGFTLADLQSRRTGEVIRRGAQIAELVQVGVYLRAGASGAVAVTATPQEHEAPPCGTPGECARLRSLADEMERE